MEKADFHIQVPLDKIRLVEAALQNTDVSFHSEESMFHMPDYNMMWSIFTGENGQYVVGALNTFLQRKGQATITKAFGNMPTQARRDLLELATIHTEWSTDYDPSVDSVDDTALQQFLEDHPDLTTAPAKINCPSCKGAGQQEGMAYGPSGCRPIMVLCSLCKGTGTATPGNTS